MSGVLKNAALFQTIDENSFKSTSSPVLLYIMALTIMSNYLLEASLILHIYLPMIKKSSYFCDLIMQLVQ